MVLSTLVNSSEGSFIGLLRLPRHDNVTALPFSTISLGLDVTDNVMKGPTERKIQPR